MPKLGNNLNPYLKAERESLKRSENAPLSRDTMEQNTYDDWMWREGYWKDDKGIFQRLDPESLKEHQKQFEPRTLPDPFEHEGKVYAQPISQQGSQEPKQRGTTRLGVESDPFVGQSKTQIANLQSFLRRHGFYEGKIDSIPGPKTKEAYYRYRDGTKVPPQSEGMRNSGWFGKDKQGNRRTPVRDAGNKIIDYLKRLKD